MLKFEKFESDLASLTIFLFRLLRAYLYATLILAAGLLPGMLGFYWIENETLIHAFLNSISVLGSMDLPHNPTSDAGVLFAAIYGLFVDTLFLVAVSILVAPVVHRALHKWHLNEK